MEVRNDPRQNGCCGILPGSGQLATPYVPVQPGGQDTFAARTALIRGTLYPCLELPYLGMVNTQEKPDTPMSQLQALGFAVQELGLYLDTHPEDEEATELFRRYTELYQAGLDRFNRDCGPMVQRDGLRDGRYVWAKTAWPWEYGANEED